MIVRRLSVKGFRNLGDISWEPCPGVNIIYGDNAQGKTNLLEAVWLFSGARSFRQAREAEFIPFGKDRAFLEASFFGEGREQEARLVYGAGRGCLLNGIPQESPSRLTGAFPCVVFSPAHLSLVREGPRERRRFLDTAIGQLMPRYSVWLTEYGRILTQRGALLKDCARYAALGDLLDVFDSRLSHVGAAVLNARMRYVRRLEEAAAGIYGGLSSRRESLSLSYAAPWASLSEGMEKEALEEALLTCLRRSRGLDLSQGVTSAGPHRDDLEILIDGTLAKSFGSQGQQRSAVLSLKLAECSILYESLGEQPAVLLDDVMSELDASRREYLLNEMEGRQVFITCCDTGYFGALRQGKIFHMESGALTQEREIAAEEGP